jgi:integrase/recombinase XerD
VSAEEGRELVPVRSMGAAVSVRKGELPELVTRAGAASVFAAEEFLRGKIRNPHTRKAYERAVRKFLEWCQERALELHTISPKHVGEYVEGLGSVSKEHQHLAALRHFFDIQVQRHAVLLNPALSVRGQRYEVVEGKTPEILIADARRLLASIDTSNVVGLRDRAALAILAYTAVRVGALAKLTRENLLHDGLQWSLRFQEKGGKSRLIPVRHDLERFLFEYIDGAGLRDAPKKATLFLSAVRKEKRLTTSGMEVNDLCRMVKRRMKDAGLPPSLSAHSFRVTVITDLLKQGVDPFDVQNLAGHADPRTTRLYDRRRKEVTRNLVERISI